MKALSIHQPWASLIASGRKTLEIRSWRMQHRGPLLICSTARRYSADLFDGERDANYPRSVTVALVDVVDCRPMTPADAEAACVPYRPGLFAVVLENIRPTKHIPISGKQQLYSVPYDAKCLGVG